MYSFSTYWHLYLPIHGISFCLQENKKYLVLREISEDGVTKLLANRESLASCDIAVFVHDR
jgi:Ras family protein T1